MKVEEIHVQHVETEPIDMAALHEAGGFLLQQGLTAVGESIAAMMVHALAFAETEDGDGNDGI